MATLDQDRTYSLPLRYCNTCGSPFHSLSRRCERCRADSGPWGPDELHDREWLMHEYVCCGRSLPRIAAEIGIGYSTLHDHLTRLDIPIRGKGTRGTPTVEGCASCRAAALERQRRATLPDMIDTLKAAKRRGEPWDSAWPRARRRFLDRVEGTQVGRDLWITAIRWAEPDLQAAYEDRAATVYNVDDTDNGRWSQRERHSGTGVVPVGVDALMS